MEPTWLPKNLVVAMHGELLAEHGGSQGLRDVGLLESALARPVKLFAYESPTRSKLAAAYGFGLAKNHAFIDGNKRVAFVAIDVFLRLNGFELTAPQLEAYEAMLAIVRADWTEAELATWIAGHSEPSPQGR